MLASSSTARRKAVDLIRSQSARSAALSTKAANIHGPIGSDNKHEVWREGIYDHDNEPK
jgi:hypothetical protein